MVTEPLPRCDVFNAWRYAPTDGPEIWVWSCTCGRDGRLGADTFDAALSQAAKAHASGAACDHPSSDGVDQTPLDDPAKAWRCNVCGVVFVQQSTQRGWRT